MKDISSVDLALEQKQRLKKFYPEIRIENLFFSFNEKKIFTGFQYIFERNKKYLIQGKSGVGKTTLISLILGYYTPENGQIMLAGKNVLDISNLMDYIAVMHQEGMFFEDTVENNISMYYSRNTEDIITLLKKAGLQKYADRKGLQTIIWEKSSNLSGGEKRRLFLIRTILSSKKILIFDEPLENLDAMTQRIVEDLILDIQGKLVIVISHRFSEEKINRFDHIIRL